MSFLKFPVQILRKFLQELQQKSKFMELIQSFNLEIPSRFAFEIHHNLLLRISSAISIEILPRLYFEISP